MGGVELYSPLRAASVKGKSPEHKTTGGRRKERGSKNHKNRNKQRGSWQWRRIMKAPPSRKSKKLEDQNTRKGVNNKLGHATLGLVAAIEFERLVDMLAVGLVPVVATKLECIITGSS